jgi:ABC-2 type transport system ATP-binding protein
MQFTCNKVRIDLTLTSMIITRNITKDFVAHGEKKQAVGGVSLSIDSGEIYCLLGGNGAGKSTLVNMLMGFLVPSSGEAFIDGKSVAQSIQEIRRDITYIPDQVNLYPELSGLENLEFFIGLFNPELARDTGFLIRSMEAAGLPGAAIHQRAREYSKGMRQKVGVALSIAKRSKILILDEPTTGLDPVSSNEFAKLITRRAREAGVTVLMVTHDLFRAKQTGDRIGIMKKGCLVHEAKTDDLTHDELERLYIEHMAE